MIRAKETGELFMKVDKFFQTMEELGISIDTNRWGLTTIKVVGHPNEWELRHVDDSSGDMPSFVSIPPTMEFKLVRPGSPEEIEKLESSGKEVER